MIKGDIRRAFTYLESGAVLLVTTSDETKDNVMSISWQMVMDFVPHIAISTGEWNESFRTILNTKECCLNVAAFDMLDKVVEIGLIHGSECDKFERFDLQKQQSESIKAPIITDCLAAIECKLVDHIEEHGILIFEGMKLWENPDRKERRVIHANGDGTFFADGEFRNFRDRMKKWVPEGSERL